MSMRNQASFWVTTFLFVFLLTAPGITAANLPPPAQVILDLSNEIRGLLNQQRAYLTANPLALQKIVNQIFAPKIDFHRVGRLILGHAWRVANAQQQTRFIQAFQQMLVETYALALLKQKNWELGFKSTQYRTNKKVVVRTTLNQPRGPKVNVHYRMHLKQHRWQIYDVMIEGISLVTTYRFAYAKIIKKKGLDGLIHVLMKRTQKISAQQ